MKWVQDFSTLSKNDTAIAGGKGASLGEMTQANIPVPPGFVILAPAFERFLESSDINIEIDAILKTVNINAMHTVEDASAQIQNLILEEKSIPKEIEDEILTSFKTLDADFVAVRSSATAEDGAEAAWAGQLDTFLNTTEETLLKNVRECWASLFTPRAIFYRFEKELNQEAISVAVVVQKMVNSESAGIAFSVHPVTEDRNQMIIEAGFGLGEAVVSGQITPDSYVVTKEPRKILDKNIIEQKKGLFRKEGGGNEWKEIAYGAEQVLSDDEILTLSETIIAIENHYGFPCDIEWAKEGGEMFIVQSRPITTLSATETSFEVDTNEGVVRILDKKQSTLLSKIFSREKPLLYFSMWNDSDRKGFKDFLDYELQNNLFLIPGLGEKGSVWYSNHELNEITSQQKNQVDTNPDFISSVTNRLDTEWEIIQPYLNDEKTIKSFEEFEYYYTHLVNWWSAMTAAFELPNLDEVDKKAQETIFSYREISEKYTEKMGKLLKTFWENTFPELKHLTFYITPTEVFKFRNGKDENLVRDLEKRTDGCFMLNGEVYLLKDLEKTLYNTGLELEELKVDGKNEIAGTVAYKGVVRGTVKIIKGFKDLDSFKAGEVLVTEMTNPDYVPIVKIAAAILTDEGGITCHAAIVAREMKKPCIIGTKIATKVLKDGDEVEVDADNGVVRILDKKQ